MTGRPTLKLRLPLRLSPRRLKFCPRLPQLRLQPHAITLKLMTMVLNPTLSAAIAMLSRQICQIQREAIMCVVVANRGMIMVMVIADL